MKDMMKDNGCCSHLWIGVVVLLAGILFLLKDLAVGDYTFGVQPWTVVFVLVGLKCVMMGFKK